jgi:hypothetical protein
MRGARCLLRDETSEDMGKLIDITGKRFGRWKVLAIHPERARRHVLWLCRCDCGTERPVRGDNLHNGTSTSCGCFARENAAKLLTKHGLSRIRAYCIWENVKQRCCNPRAPSYPYYGGRGITVCERWLTFENFYADMGDPADGMSLDRIDNDDNYEPGNCKWSTRSQQNSNRRSAKRKRRRADVADIVAYANALARARGMLVDK